MSPIHTVLKLRISWMGWIHWKFLHVLQCMGILYIRWMSDLSLWNSNISPSHTFAAQWTEKLTYISLSKRPTLYVSRPFCVQHILHFATTITIIINFSIVSTWLAGRSLQRASPNTHRPMKVERGVRGTDTEIMTILW